MRDRTTFKIAALIIAALQVVGPGMQSAAQSEMRVIELLADKDSRFKIGRKASPTLTLRAGEEV